MSENLDLVRSIYADWEQGDWGSAEWADRDIEFVIADGPDPSSWQGVPAMAQGWREFLSLWKGYRGKALEYREIDGERVYVLIRVSARGLEIGQLSGNVFTLRAAKVTRLAIYWDP